MTTRGRCAGTAAASKKRRRGARPLSEARDLDWNLFLGAAPDVEYHPIYHPFNWRGWVDWGGGARRHGRASDRSSVLGAEPRLADDGRDRLDAVQRRRFPTATTTYYEFPARNLPPVKLTWYDGGLLPPKPEEIGDER